MHELRWGWVIHSLAASEPCGWATAGQAAGYFVCRLFSLAAEKSATFHTSPADAGRRGAVKNIAPPSLRPIVHGGTGSVPELHSAGDFGTQPRLVHPGGRSHAAHLHLFPLRPDPLRHPPGREDHLGFRSEAAARCRAARHGLPGQLPALRSHQHGPAQTADVTGKRPRTRPTIAGQAPAAAPASSPHKSRG
jgi:hypothetical protein